MTPERAAWLAFLVAAAFGVNGYWRPMAFCAFFAAAMVVSAAYL